MIPDVTAEAELASIKAHSVFFKTSREEFIPLTDMERSMALQVCEKAYGTAKYRLPEDFLQRSHFERVVRRLEFTSSPGYPYCLEASSIGEWLGWDGVFFAPGQLDRLWWDVQTFMAGHMEVLYRVFVKSEPHTKSKAAVKRWRLIICPPLFEQVTWSMVFGPGNDREIDTVGTTPSMQGMKLSQGDWKVWRLLFRQKQYDAALDKSAWDWTCHRELISLDLELRSRLLTSRPEEKLRWRSLAEKLYEQAFDHPRLVLSNGMILEQVYPGIMKSGCVNTISTNSHCQLFAHIIACVREGTRPWPLPVAVGDDTLGCVANTPRVETFLTLGVILKEVGGMQFVGHHWRDDGPVPAYNAKHLFRYLMMADELVPDFLDSMVRLYAHAAAFQRLWRGLADVHGVHLPSEEYVRFWYDYDADVEYAWD